MEKIDIIKQWFWRIFAILLFVAVLLGVYEQNWFNVMAGMIAIAIIVIPLLLERTFKVNFPSEIELAFLIFIYASLYLGEINTFYEKFWWWDLFLHSTSGIIFAFLAFIIVYLIHADKRTTLKLSPFFLSLFAFSFALMLGVMWEIFEYLMDQTFGLNMQKSGLTDTMWDLMVNMLGALCMAIYSYRYQKKQKIPLQRLEKWLKRKYS